MSSLRYIAITSLLISLIFTTGCEVKKNTTNSVSQVSVKESNTSSGKEDLIYCEKELHVLKDIDNEKYIALSGKFQQMMKGAAGYSKVRSGVNQSTQDAIDALYRYSSTKICTEIRAETLEALASKPGV
jgi:hypothetical protein